MISRQEAQARVAIGAAYLDRRRPGWFDEINVGTLTLHDACGCVLGQLTGDKWWVEWQSVLGLDDAAISICGFDLSDKDDASTPDNVSNVEAFKPLQDAWIEAIADRRLRSEQPASINAVDPHATSTGKPSTRA